ncbi:MAG: hypothetical protein ACR2O6_00540 [Ilumatobacteraceae bacterium]
MGDVLRASLELPTVIFTGLLAIAAGMWLLSLLGVLDIESDATEGALDDVLEPLNVSEVPATVLLTLFALAGWFVSVLASVFLLDDASGTALVLGAIAIGIAAAVAAIAITLWLAPKLARAFATARAPSKRDLLGRLAEIRSETVTETRGRADARWPDDTVSTIDVRTSPNSAIDPGALRKGDSALIIDWVSETDDFIVDRVPPELSE